MNHIGTKTIETRRLVLRRFTPADAQPMFDNWANDLEVTKFITWPPHGTVEVTQSIVKGWVESYEKPNSYQWAIELDGQVIGSISVVTLKERAQMAEIGYCLGRHWWHKGIMSEALRGVMKFLFEEVGVNCITAKHDVRNPNSGGVMKKCGMTLDGILRQSAWNNQGICDMACYSILRSEWKPES